MKLFKSKSQKVKEACQDIHVIINDSINIIFNMQECVQDMQKNVQELIRLNQESLKLYDDMSVKLDKLAGESE